MPTTSLDALTCDQVNRKMWVAAPWRWAIVPLTSISLSDTNQDFALSNTDLYRLIRARITRTDSTPDESHPLNVLEWLEPALNYVQGMYAIQACSMVATTTTVRLDTAISVPSGVTIQMDGEYQTVPTKITATSSTITFNDEYAETAIEGLKWAYMVLAKDPRAGGMAVNSKGDKTYSGQYAVFMASIEDMKQAEDFGNGENYRFPDDSLGVGRYTSGNPFGWG